MDDFTKNLRLRVDLDRQVVTIPQRGHLTYGDSAADTITAEVYRGNTPVTLDGIGAGAVFYAPPSRAEIKLEATASGNTVSVVLDEHCYVEEGYYELEIYLRDSGKRVTILSISGNIHRAGSGVIIDASGTIPSIDDLLDMIDDIDDAKHSAYAAAEKAMAAAELVRGAMASANTLEPGANATVNVKESNGVWIFTFGLPRGEQGPAGQIDNVTIESIPGLSDALDPLRGYPVGSIYMNTTDPTSPASLFGGDWLPITDRFLLAAGSSYAAGSTGGEAAVLLTIATMANHTHKIGILRNALQSAEGGSVSRLDSAMSTTTDNVIEATGGGEPHNNMPPYRAVYMWERVA